MNLFFNSQFDYCPLVWLLHSRSFKNETNCLHERVLGIAYSDFKAYFEISWKKMGLSQCLSNT